MKMLYSIYARRNMASNEYTSSCYENENSSMDLLYVVTKEVGSKNYCFFHPSSLSIRHTNETEL